MNHSQTDKEYYLATWREMLCALLGWSERDVLQWATETGKLQYLDNSDDALYHEEPTYWAGDLLIPNALWQELAPLQRVLIRRDLLQALGHGQQYAPASVNWHTRRSGVEKVLNGWGAELPQPRPMAAI